MGKVRVKSAAIKFTLAVRLYLYKLGIFSLRLTTSLEEVDNQYFYFISCEYHLCRVYSICVKHNSYLWTYDLLVLMRADPIRGQVGGGWALEIETFVGPVKWHRAVRQVLFGAQKSRDFQGLNLSCLPK
jgi:hypothetical protein